MAGTPPSVKFGLWSLALASGRPEAGPRALGSQISRAAVSCRYPKRRMARRLFQLPTQTERTADGRYRYHRQELLQRRAAAAWPTALPNRHSTDPRVVAVLTGVQLCMCLLSNYPEHPL